MDVEGVALKDSERVQVVWPRLPDSPNVKPDGWFSCLVAEFISPKKCTLLVL